MARLQNAFAYLLPILHDTESEYIPNPIANSTALGAATDQLNNTYLHNVLSDASMVLLATHDILAPAAPDLSDHDEPSDSGVVLSALTFYSGRKCGQQCSYNGYLYSHNKSQPNGHRYWDFKDSKIYSPQCKGRLITLDSTVTKENPHPIICRTTSLNEYQMYSNVYSPREPEASFLPPLTRGSLQRSPESPPASASKSAPW